MISHNGWGQRTGRACFGIEDGSEGTSVIDHPLLDGQGYSSIRFAEEVGTRYVEVRGILEWGELDHRRTFPEKGRPLIGLVLGQIIVESPIRILHLAHPILLRYT